MSSDKGYIKKYASDVAKKKASRMADIGLELVTKYDWSVVDVENSLSAGLSKREAARIAYDLDIEAKQNKLIFA